MRVDSELLSWTKRQVFCKVFPTADVGGAEVEKPVKDMKKSGETMTL